MLMNDPKNSNASSCMSGIDTAPRPEQKSSGRRLISATLASVTGSSFGRRRGWSSWQRPLDHGFGEEVVVAGAGDLIDGGALASVARAYPHEVEPAPVERFVGAGDAALRLDLDRAPVGEREGSRCNQAGDGVAALAVGGGLPVGPDPLGVVAEVDDGNRPRHVGAGPAAVAVHERAVRKLPVPDAEEPVVELDLPPEPQRAAAMVAEAPGVIALTDPPGDLADRAVEGVRAGVGAGLEDVGLVPHQLVARAHGAPPERVRLGARSPCQIEADGAIHRFGPQADLAHRGHDLDTSARDLRGVRVAVVRPALHPEHLLAPDPSHLQ